MAKTPEAVRGLLEKVWKPARKRARSPTATRLQELIARRAAISKLAAWDWRYYAEKLRKRDAATSTSPRSSRTSSSTA